MAIAAVSIVMIIGALIGVLSLWGMVQPARLMAFVSGAIDKPWGMVVAVGVRLVMGVAMILAAPGSRFPLAFEVIGWIAIAAAVIILIVGRKRLRQMIGWFLKLPAGAVRGWLVVGIAFGAFLLYGVI